MGKICLNCGKPIFDDMSFCISCGTPIKTSSATPPKPAEPPVPPQPMQPVYPQPVQPIYQQPVQPVYQQPVYQQPVQPVYQQPVQPIYQQPVYQQPPAPAPSPAPYTPPVVQRNSGSKKPLIIGCIIAVVVVAIVIGCILHFAGSDSSGGSSGGSTKNSYTDPIDNYIDVYINGEADKIERMAPDAYWEWYEYEYDESVDEIIDDFEDEWYDYNDNMEDEYGSNIRVTYDIQSEEDISSKELRLIAEALHDQYDIDEDSVTAGKVLETELTIKGSEDADEDDMEIVVVKIDGKWYWIRYYDYDDEYRVYFQVG